MSDSKICELKLRRNNHSLCLYIAIICYHSFEDNAPRYSFKFGTSNDPDKRIDNQGLIPYKCFYYNDYLKPNTRRGLGVWETAYKIALEDTIGVNYGARYGGAGATECFGVFETLEEVKEYLDDLVKEMHLQLIEYGTEVRIPLVA